MAEAPSEIKFKYIFADDYNPVYVNGAYGGATARGEIVANFFLERQALLTSVTHAVDKEGTLGKEIARTPKEEMPAVVRYVSAGIVLSVETAKLIHAWLGEQIQEAEQSGERLRANIREKYGG